jgi:hypothetical protein
MRVTLLNGLTALMLLASARAAEYSPADPTKPLFRIFAPIAMKTPDGAPRERVTFDDKHPLLVVRTVSDLVLARDNKGVLITLTSADAKKFAAITRRYNDGLLLLEAEGEVLQAMHITAPIIDGIIGFKHPEEGAIAEYLRRRFRIAEFR